MRETFASADDGIIASDKIGKPGWPAPEGSYPE
jgi:hypothetical protein